jgi:hypothetical protein
MNAKLSHLFAALALLELSAIHSPLSSARAQGTAFTYQGDLMDGANPANGSYDLRFSLFNASSGGSQVGSNLTTLSVSVANGLFTTALDFGPGIFSGTPLWLDTSVRPSGSGAFSELAPRQALTPAPYAITAQNLTGTVPLAQLPSTVAMLSDYGMGNFFAGPQAGNSTLTGIVNTAVGDGALRSTTGGSWNTAEGNDALGENLMGSGNAAFGALALLNNVSGNDNAAFGDYALYGNVDASYNTASGAFALAAYARGLGAITGSGNTADGAYALYSDQSGSNNTAVGFQSLYNNLGGNKNTSQGYDALYDNTSGVDNTAQGYAALYSNATGSYNVAVGDSALYANTNGLDNTALGFDALKNVPTADGNVAVGYQALQNGLSANGAGDNGYSVAVGYQALQNSSLDSGAVAVGAGALQNDTARNANDLLGGYCGNTAIGYQALQNNSGLENTALGAGALSPSGGTSGAGNTAVGASAMGSSYYPVKGNNNVAVGYLALNSPNGSVTGSNNVAVGYWAGQNITSGNNNIDIANLGVSGDDNAIRIGTPGTQTTTIVAGIWGGTLPGSQGVPVYVDAGGHLGTVTSSARFKQDIQNMAGDSEALYGLRPVTFKYQPAIDPKGRPQFGLIAEEVDQVDPKLVVRDDHERIYSVRYDAINAMLLNEFLKEHRTVAMQTTEIQNLKQQNQSLAERLNALEAAVHSLTERN